VDPSRGAGVATAPAPGPARPTPARSKHHPGRALPGSEPGDHARALEVQSLIALARRETKPLEFSTLRGGAAQPTDAAGPPLLAHQGDAIEIQHHAAAAQIALVPPLRDPDSTKARRGNFIFSVSADGFQGGLRRQRRLAPHPDDFYSSRLRSLSRGHLEGLRPKPFQLKPAILACFAAKPSWPWSTSKGKPQLRCGGSIAPEAIANGPVGPGR